MNKTIKRTLVRSFTKDNGDQVSVYSVPVYSMVAVKDYQKQYLCMVTYDSKDVYEAWLTSDEMVNMIKSSSKYDYYTLGDSQEVEYGSHLEEQLTGYTEEESVYTVEQQIADINEAAKFIVWEDDLAF